MLFKRSNAVGQLKNFSCSKCFNILDYNKKIYNRVIKNNQNTNNCCLSFGSRKMISENGSKPFCFVDSHVHIDTILKRGSNGIEKLDQIISEEFERLPSLKKPPANYKMPREAVWEGSIHICCDPDTIEIAESILSHPKIHVGAGHHPELAESYDSDVESKYLEFHKNPKVIAWGEIGLDYHYTEIDPEKQKKVFIRQLQLAVDINKPIIIHTRKAEQDTFEILKEHVPSDWKIHIHCFTGPKEMALKFLDNFPNLVIGFTGILTFDNAEDVRETVREIPLERLILETDGPFLAPIPYRRRIATSGMIPIIAEKISEIKKVNVELVYKNSRENTKKIYNI